MTEGTIAKVRAAAELEVEPLLRIFKQTLIDTYVKGFLKGIESMEDEGAASKRLNKEVEALQSGALPIDDEPIVKLKPDAILKRHLKQEEFSVRVWRTLKDLNIETLGDILQVSEKMYLSRKSFGINSLNDLRDYVKRFGYKLKEK